MSVLGESENKTKGGDIVQRSPNIAITWLCLVSVFLFNSGLCADPAGQRAQRILNQAGVQGGLVVHVGCEDPELLVRLRKGRAYRVHALDRDAAKADRARKWIQAQGCYGSVAVDTWDGRRLPYADNLVNVLVLGAGTRRCRRHHPERRGSRVGDDVGSRPGEERRLDDSQETACARYR